MSLVLSICIPVYNGGEGLYENISQILSCNSDKFEIIVNDNCSEDGSLEKIKEISDYRLRIFQNENPIPPNQNWYTALKKGNGKYLMLLRDNDRIYTDNLLSFLSLLEKSNYIAIKNGKDWIRPYDGEISIAEYFYYAFKFSHISFFVYLKEKFDSVSFKNDCTGYPQILWEIQMLSNYSPECRYCYINSQIPIVYAPEINEKSRTRGWYDAEIKKGRPVNYTYKDALYLEEVYLKRLMEIYDKKEEILKIDYFFYCAGIVRATCWYYDHMHDKTHRYGVPYVNYSKKKWIGMSKEYYRDKLIQLEIIGEIPLKYQFVMRLVATYNKILFEISYYIKRKFYNPIYILSLINIRILRMVIRSFEKIFL